MILASLAFAAILQQPDGNFSGAWESIRSSIENRYYARQKQHARMEDLLDKYQPKAQAAKTRDEFEKDVNDMIADFGDSHFGFFTKSDQEFYLMQSLTGGHGEMPTIGAWFRPQGHGFAIQMLLNGGACEASGLRKGDEVDLIDGRPFTPIDSLASKDGQSVSLTYTRDGTPRTAQVAVTKADATKFFLDATQASIRVIEHGGKKYGYIHLWTMSNEAQKSALANAVFGKLKDTDGFILDIRDGFGGRPEGFGDPFFRPEVHLSWEAMGFDTEELFGYQRPLVVIINRGSRSAKEVFAYIMKSSGRATLVGETTAGNVLGTSPTPVGDWGYLEIPMVDVKANGVRLEKVGVSPDVAVAREFDADGTDLYLSQALKILATKATSGHSSR